VAVVDVRSKMECLQPAFDGVCVCLHLLSSAPMRFIWGSMDEILVFAACYDVVHLCLRLSKWHCRRRGTVVRDAH
jgi:hypothetical protein